MDLLRGTQDGVASLTHHYRGILLTVLIHKVTACHRSLETKLGAHLVLHPFRGRSNHKILLSLQAINLMAESTCRTAT